MILRRLGGMIVSCAALAAGTAAPAAAQPQPSPCPTQAAFDWQGRSVFQRVTVQAAGTAAYEGTVLRPSGPRRTLGRRPGVVLMHGLGGSQCGLWWAARHLAGHGYVTLVITHDGDLPGHVQAVRTGVRWLRSSANPYRGVTLADRIGVAGHSQGSQAAMLAQDEPGVQALAAIDSLKANAEGDAAAAVGCLVPRNPITPRVPALGFAMDFPCQNRATETPPDLKKTGHALWKAAGQPTMTLVMRGYEHNDFTARGSEAQLRDVGHFLLAWFDRYLRRDRAATKRVLARRVNGVRTRQLLSTTYRSAAFLPGRIDCEDYRRCLRPRR
ncbi:MAG: Chlorophyllase enzyme [Thermoleophilaceae bacterium]|jgi:dienelactone hydrolase|nr:Chlorophyllase enzyme [Thermoleophilaceae bacterium]